MTTMFILALKKLLTKFALSLISEKFLEWAFFSLAEKIVLSTATDHDDKWLAKFKEVYEESKK
ncbi:MAG: hypothetical protein ACRC6V_17020 [Bacteroidales bacterium]